MEKRDFTITLQFSETLQACKKVQQTLCVRTKGHAHTDTQIAQSAQTSE